MHARSVQGRDFVCRLLLELSSRLVFGFRHSCTRCSDVAQQKTINCCGVDLGVIVVVIPGALAPGQEAPDPMILVSVMGTVQYGLLEAKPPPEARPFTQSFVRPPPSPAAVEWMRCKGNRRDTKSPSPSPSPLPVPLPLPHATRKRLRARESLERQVWPHLCLLAATDSGCMREQVLGKDTATGSYYIVTDNYRLL